MDDGAARCVSRARAGSSTRAHCAARRDSMIGRFQCDSSVCTCGWFVQFIEAERRGLALGFLDQDHWSRHLARSILSLRSDTWPAANFEHFIMVSIVVSSFLMGMRSCDVAPGSVLDTMLERADALFMLIFVSELVRPCGGRPAPLPCCAVVCDARPC